MSARVWRIALPSLLIAVVLLGADTRRVNPFEPRVPLQTSPRIENVPIQSAERLDSADLLQDPEVVALFAHLFQLAGLGTRDLERAAFLVREPDESWSCLLWPMNAAFRTEEFRGRIPDGAVAIVHTHPNRIPQASLEDSRAAIAAGLPLYTITWANVTVIDERTGVEARIFRNRDWRKSIPASFRDEGRCREIGPRQQRLREGLLASGQ